MRRLDGGLRAALAVMLGATVGCSSASTRSAVDAGSASSSSASTVASTGPGSSRASSPASSSAASTGATSSTTLTPASPGPRDAGADDSVDAGLDAPGDVASPLPDARLPDGSTLALTSLTVSEAGNAALRLVPYFSPEVHDYYVQCQGSRQSPSSNMLTVTVATVAGASASLSLETPGGAVAPLAGAAAVQTVTAAVANDQAVVVTASAGSASVEYWVRCIPDDFPEMQWTPHAGGSPRAPGYYLFGTMSLPGGPRGALAQESAYAIVLDPNGVPVWYRYDNDWAAYDVETLTPGAISYSGPWIVDQLGGSVVYPIADSALDGGSATTPDEHELRVLPNGHFLALSSATQYVDLTGLTVPTSSGGRLSYGPNTPIYGCFVQEFDAAGTIYWQWSATDHFNPVTAMVVKGDGDLAGTTAEPFHCNALDVDPATGNILVSARDMASVFYIEKATGKVLWKMGGAGADSCFDAPIYVPVDDPFTAQHDARLQPGWAETCSGGKGQVSVFDDESYTANPARGVVYDVVIAGGCGGDGGASTSGTTGATRVWEYRNDFGDGGISSHVCGSFRISSDGSRILGWGQSDPSPNGLVFTEVDDQARDILDLVCPDRSSSYRAVKVPLSAFSLDVLRASSGL